MTAARVLLVDDDESSRLSLSALLDEEGFVVTEAASYDEAMLRIAEGRWDLVLLDQHLGAALGSDLVPTVRGSVPNAKIVLVSGSAEDVVSGGDDFFAKGGAFEDLLAKLRRLL
jgi:two-component system response regulator RegA